VLPCLHPRAGGPRLLSCELSWRPQFDARGRPLHRSYQVWAHLRGSDVGAASGGGGGGGAGRAVALAAAQEGEGPWEVSG
jgi:hypothetical protein